MKKKLSGNNVLAVMLVFALLAGVPVLLLCLGVQRHIAVLAVCLVDLAAAVCYGIFVRNPIRKLIVFIDDVRSGDFGGECNMPPSIRSLRTVAERLDNFVGKNLIELLCNLKLELLHMQDASNSFLTEVQNAVTTSSRISLGSDYISERIVALEKLLQQSLDENDNIKASLEEYRNLVQRQVDTVSATDLILTEIESGLRSSIASLGEKKKESSKLVSITADCAGKVHGTIDSVSKIAESVGMLKETISIIASVAGQTNLLAMNAAIEAAHAGEAGAGFAVVAQEIRNLAETTSKQVKSISQSLKGMTALISDAVSSSTETGAAFAGIDGEVGKFVKTFDEVIDYYTELCRKNEHINTQFSDVKNVEQDISAEMNRISSAIEGSHRYLQGIKASATEISGIVLRNTNEALQLSRAQAPIYFNAVENGKHLELIRKMMDVFRMPNVPLEVWKSDKGELWHIIEAMFAHLDWTVKLLNFLHGKSNEVLSCLLIRTTKFDEWLYGDGVRKYMSLPCIKEAVKLDHLIHERAQLLVKLCNGGKEKEATIEFSEILEFSRKLVVALSELKTIVVKNLGKDHLVVPADLQEIMQKEYGEYAMDEPLPVMSETEISAPAENGTPETEAAEEIEVLEEL